MIYLDNNATTPPDPEVLQLVREIEHQPLNPSSPHTWGRKAKELLLLSRKKVQSCLGVQEGLTVFCSSGTEAINLAIRGLLQEHPGHVITSACEHPSVLKTLESLQSNQNRLTVVQPGALGILTVEHILEHAREDTRLIVSSSANHETGLLTDLKSLADLTQKKGYLLVVDATAHWGRFPFTFHPGINALCLSGHKLHSIKGAALCHFHGVSPKAILTGGGQEMGLRSGTENIVAIAAMAKAMDICSLNMKDIVTNLNNLSLETRNLLEEFIPNLLWNGTGPKLPHTLNFSLPNLDADVTVFQLDMEGIAVGFGSACNFNVRTPSQVLLGMGYDLNRVNRSIRVSFSRMNTLEEVRQLCKTLRKIQFNTIAH
ncbi:cysteine desulfurase family protein [Candidatus Similichlamydia laticola]|uniref:Cysteine desulfurase n=1 Tax=Candidatus Similichlamydia laticola TaxID=2170265 RepID=A0A369KI47_9BACT|nr:cysteine desulfurase family protein [Candidatus Similichlamydia laticola]RDB31444.1 Cysteine desulfurase [Candidatus Similichlamydia laticola]